jgi:hypothetical protein
MSDELLKNEGEDDEVEGHTLKAGTRQENDEGAEDVEAHLSVRAATDDDDSEDVEAHRFKA